MYSIPYPVSSSIPPFKVPYVAICQCSLSGPYDFDTYLDHAITISFCFLLAASSWTEDRLTASLIQPWLFFGLASEALGRDVSHHEYIELSYSTSSPTDYNCVLLVIDNPPGTSNVNHSLERNIVMG